MHKTPLAPAIFLLLHSIAALASAQVTSVQGAAAPEDRNAKDVVVVTKPHFRYQERHEIELANEKGPIGNDMYTYLDFTIGKKIYSAWWRSRSSSAPVYLSQSLQYRFVLRLEDQSSKCEVVRIWRGKELIWENPKTIDQVKLADESAIREKLEHIQLQLLKAFKNKDVKAYTDHITSSYSTNMIGSPAITPSRFELESEARSEMDNTVSIGPIIREIRELKVNGRDITLVVHQKTLRVLRDEGSTRRWEVGIVQREHWIETDEGLKLASIVGLEITYLIEDGELVSGSKKDAIDWTRPTPRRTAARPRR